MTTPRTVAKSTANTTTQSQSDVYSLEVYTERSFRESKDNLPSPILRSKATPTSKSRICKSSTCFTLANLGFHGELSRLQKLLLIFCSLMAVYETFTPAEKASNDFIGLFTPPDEFTLNFSRSLAAMIAFIIMVATLKNIGLGLRNIKLYSARLDDHGKQLEELKKTVDTQASELVELKKDLKALKKQNAIISSSVTLSPALFAVRMTPPLLLLPKDLETDAEIQLQDSPTATPRQRATV